MIHRSIFAAVLLAWTAFAAPQLTTIQDTLYKADGTRFNGLVTITWSNFQAGDSTQIVTQSRTIKVANGNLRVQLVPTTTGTPPTYYSVTYNSDGLVQFKEVWSVPESSQAVRLSDVRVDLGNDTAAGGTAPVNEADVTGLVADLGARPIKGPGYAPGHVAVVNATGAIESVTGADSDCVHVDGSSGPCGSASSFVDGETPSGIVDGSNTSFSLSAAPDPVSSLDLYRNGLMQKSGQDFTLSGSSLQLAAAPQPGDTLLASYRLAGDSASPSQMYPAAQVLCSGTGASTTGTTLSSVGVCAIPAGVLLPGDRVEVRYDLQHSGAVSGFSFEIHWGATTVAHRDAAVSDSLVTGRADAAILSAGAQLDFQSWGAVLPFSAGVASAADAYSSGLTIDFRGMLAQSGDTLTLGNFTVVRFP
ncbi:MAG TPA: hypothetical protein VE959_01185 [Bryobacteraceae bacterium]|nr:hypothetical protein [Bryobacteraceae bacterium]